MKTTQELTEEVKDAIAKEMYDMECNGNDGYRAIRIAPDGDVYSHYSASWECGPDEYYGNVPHIMTIWSQSSFWEASIEDEKPESWTDCRCEMDDYDYWMQLDIEMQIEKWIDEGNYQPS